MSSYNDLFPKKEASRTAQAVAAHAPWSVQDTVIGALLTLVPLLSLSLVSQHLSSTTTATSGSAAVSDSATAIATFIQIAILEGVFLIAPLYYALRHAGINWPQALGVRGFHPGLGIGLLVLAAGTAIIASYSYDAIVKALHVTVQTNADSLLLRLEHMPLTLDATLLGAVLVAPICEEVFFRGYLLQGLRSMMSDGWAVVLSSVIFAAVHADLGSFPLLLVLGLLMGTLRVVTGSIWPGVILHTFNNTLTSIILIASLHR